MSGPTLLDTGPLVAFLNGRDHYHEWALGQWGRLRPPLLTCEAVLSEACFLLRSHIRGAGSVIELLKRRLIVPSFRLDDEAATVAKLLLRYDNVPISLADACLVRMTELHAESVVLTLDRHFTVYRRHGRQVIPTLMPRDRLS